MTTPSELLDKILDQFQKLPPNAKFSETVKAHANAVKFIKESWDSEYQKGFNEASEKFEKDKLNNQIKNN